MKTINRLRTGSASVLLTAMSLQVLASPMDLVTDKHAGEKNHLVFMSDYLKNNYSNENISKDSLLRTYKKQVKNPGVFNRNKEAIIYDKNHDHLPDTLTGIHIPDKNARLNHYYSISPSLSFSDTLTDSWGGTEMNCRTSGNLQVFSHPLIAQVLVRSMTG